MATKDACRVDYRAYSAAHAEPLNRLALWLLLSRLGLFDQGLLAHHDHNSRFSHMEPPPVGLSVKTNLRPLREADVTVNDCAANPRMPTNIHVIVHNRIGHLAVAVHSDVIPNDAPLHASAGNHRASRNDGIERHAHALRIGKDEFRRGILVLPCA